MKTIQIHIKVPSDEYCIRFALKSLTQDCCEYCNEPDYYCPVFVEDLDVDRHGILKCYRCREAGEP